MQQWTREDLPHWDTIRDADDMHGNGMRSRVIDIALDTIVEHLNERHPKSDLRKVEAQRDTQKTKARRARRARDKWKAACETATANAQMWMDEAIEQRERADEAESRLDAATKRAEAAGRELAAVNDDLDRARDDERLHAWGQITRHPFFADTYMAQGTLVDSMLAKLDWAEEAMVVECDVMEADPVEELAEELYESGLPEGIADVARWGNLAPGGKDMYRRIATHVLKIERQWAVFDVMDMEDELEAQERRQ